MEDERIALWIIYSIITVLIFWGLSGKIIDARNDNLFVKKYLSTDVGFLQNTALLTDANIKINYSLEQMKTNFTLDFQESKVIVYDKIKGNAAVFICAEDKNIQQQDISINNPTKIEIIKSQNMLIRK